MNQYDAVLVGSGIMSSTLAVLLHELEPNLRLLIIERLGEPALESSSALNNAGTGHAANCELNYTPEDSEGKLNLEKAIDINLSFERSLEFWASLASRGKINPQTFLHRLPHISFVKGDHDVSFLKKRYKSLRDYKAFSLMKWTEDYSELNSWIPLMMEGRDSDEKLAATRVDRGTDVDFGMLTTSYINYLSKSDVVDIMFNSEVYEIKNDAEKQWRLIVKGKDKSFEISTPFVFLGAGGGALPLLQKSGIPESLGYAGFPVSGQWLVCSNKQLINKHFAKVYGKAKIGSPPMSLPHLDSRWIQGKRSLLFGPFAGFSGKFLKQGSNFDLIRSIRSTNLVAMLQVGIRNKNLVNYLLNQLLQTKEDQIQNLREFAPISNADDWSLFIAGQRVQIIKKTSNGGVLQMGTEIVTSSDGTLAALLGASPGASTAVSIMLEVLSRCWSVQMTSNEWQSRLRKLFPSYGYDLHSEDLLLDKTRERSDSLLGLA